MNTAAEIYGMTNLPDFTWVDCLSSILFFSLGLYLVIRFKKKRKINSVFYFPFFYAKIIALAAFVGLYYYYFKGGDTFAYFMGGEMLWKIFIDSPDEYFQLIFSENSNLKPLFEELLPYTGYKSDYSAFVMIKIISLLSIITHNSYWAISLIFCFISFFGNWIFYEGFNKMFGKLNTITSFLVLFFPSVLLWTTGLLKDTLCYSLLGVIVYQMSSFGSDKVDFKRLLVVMVLFFMLYYLKFYIVITFLLAYLFYVLFLIFLKKALINQRLIFSTILTLSTIIIIWDYFHDFYVYHFLIGRIKDFHFWHGIVANHGYKFEGIQYNLYSLIKKIPEAIHVALYRPYLWEVKGVRMTIPLLESAFLFGLLVWVMIKVNGKVVKVFKDKPELFLALIFVLILAFTVGITAYSFGALSRYRVPLIPFYLILMFKSLELTQQRIKGI